MTARRAGRPRTDKMFLQSKGYTGRRKLLKMLERVMGGPCVQFISAEIRPLEKVEYAMNKISKMVALLVLTVVPVSAFAGEGGNERHEKAKFPMAAAEFRAKVTARQTHHKERMERFLTEMKIPADKAKEIRERSAQRESKVNAKVSEVIKDGTVTADEAKAVRDVAREGKPHKGKGERKGNGGKRQGQHSKPAEKKQ